MKDGNFVLNRAKRRKFDEFYTRIEDIEKELCHYKRHFKDKVVLCNCDDPEYSDFFKYFELNFTEFGLKKLITTHYERKKDSYKIELHQKANGVVEKRRINLRQNGDFRSPECVKALEESDIICTNPPFSLFREYIEQLETHQKRFLVVGNRNAVSYKEIFPLIKDNKVWLGRTPKIQVFRVPSYYEGKDMYLDPSGTKFVKNVGLAYWFTNLDYAKRHEELILYKHYTPEEYPKYDNYDAINVDKVVDIPCDYDGVMGVPITFLDKYNPEQFEILGCSYSYGEPIGYHYDGKDYSVSISRKNVYKRLFIRRKYQ